MPNLSSRAAIIAMVGVLSAVPPVFAAPNGNMNNSNSNQQATSGQIDCSLPANANLKYCMDLLKSRGPVGGPPPTSGPTPTNGQTTTNGQNSNAFHPPAPKGNTHKGPKSGSFNWNQQDRSYFHKQFNFGSFGSFSFFLAPNFSITIGTALPQTYHTHLRRVPANVYRDYPWFRGYYFFIDRHGDFVIVSPSSFKIIAVL